MTDHLAAYAEALHAETELVAALLPRGIRVAHLAWGGGTLTALSPDDLAALMDRLRRHSTFTPDAELAIESDPRTLTPEMARRIGSLGFTRTSFGVQEFDPSCNRRSTASSRPTWSPARSTACAAPASRGSTST